jgi:hypothetical protein
MLANWFSTTSIFQIAREKDKDLHLQAIRDVVEESHSVADKVACETALILALIRIDSRSHSN